MCVMSRSEADSGQIQALPAEDEHPDDISDDNDENSAVERNRERNVVIGLSGRACVKLMSKRIMKICKETGLFLIFALTYAALVNDNITFRPTKVSNTPEAYPFFPEDSIVRDYYGGHLSRALERARRSDVGFIMFYAPWDRESQEVRREFQIAAKHMQKLVDFSAVNCWQPGGECRNRYNRVYDWPILIVYPAHGRGIEYKGPKTALHMIRFLQAFMEPLVRVNNLEVQRLRQKHDAVVVANVNASPGSLDYSIIYSVALRYLERDPFQEVVFAVNTEHRPTAREITLYTWNNTLTYIDGNWRLQSLLNWIHQNAVQVSAWVSPTGSKSKQLSNYVQPGPALILFTPRNPLYDSIDYYDMLHEIALQYNYCRNNTRDFGAYLLSLGIHYNRINNYKNTKMSCENPSKSQEAKFEFPSTVTYLNVDKWNNNSYCFAPSNKEGACMKNIIPMEPKFREEFRYKEEMEEICKNLNAEDKTIKSTEWAESDYILGSYRNLYDTSMISGLNDPKSPVNLYQTRLANWCQLRLIAQRYTPLVFSKSIAEGENINVDITGLSCQVNRSLSLFAMDSLKYHHFADSLSVDISLRKHKTAVVILDEKMESHYVLDGAVTDSSVRNFILNFSRNNLKRALTTSSKRYNHTHTYRPKLTHEKNQKITELDSKTFLRIIMQKYKAVVVLYHSKQCSFCNGISYIFVTTARVFSPMLNMRFARIDGDLNTLPWEFTMESYPRILFVPDVKKSESRVFPKETSITVPNLIQFILSNLSPSLKLHAMWSLCNRTKDDDNVQCMAKVRIETLSLIEKGLKEWRLSDSMGKAIISDNLWELKHLHLLLAHRSTNADPIHDSMTRLHFKMSRLTQYRNKAKKSS